MLLSTRETADILGIDVRNVVSAIERGSLTAEKDERGRWRIEQAAVLAYKAKKQRNDDQLPGLPPSSSSAPRAFKVAVDQIVRAVHDGTLDRQTALALLIDEELIDKWRAICPTASSPKGKRLAHQRKKLAVLQAA